MLADYAVLLEFLSGQNNIDSKLTKILAFSKVAEKMSSTSIVGKLKAKTCAIAKHAISSECIALRITLLHFVTVFWPVLEDISELPW